MASPASTTLRVLDGGGARAVPEAGLPLTLDVAFRAHAAYVARVALRVLGRPSEVDDLVQDVFLCALPRLGSLRDPAALRSWLAVIAARLARRRLRSRRFRVWLGVGADYDDAELTDPAASPQDRALLGELYRALDRLPAPQRIAWILRHVEGQELAAIAQACDCSLATAKRWIYAAETALRTETAHG